MADIPSLRKTTVLNGTCSHALWVAKNSQRIAVLRKSWKGALSKLCLARKGKERAYLGLMVERTKGSSIAESGHSLSPNYFYRSHKVIPSPLDWHWSVHSPFVSISYREQGLYARMIASWLSFPLLKCCIPLSHNGMVERSHQIATSTA